MSVHYSSTTRNPNNKDYNDTKRSAATTAFNCLHDGHFKLIQNGWQLEPAWLAKKSATDHDAGENESTRLHLCSTPQRIPRELCNR